jgi:hypothetical protein
MSTKNFTDWAGYKEALLEGLDEKQSKLIGAVMENSHEQNVKTKDEVNGFVTESTSSGSTVTSNISRYDMMFMPIVRRTMPSLLAMDLVGVQPLDGPRGIVRTLRMRYSEDTETTDASGVNAVDAGTEASGQNIYEKYSLLAQGGAYDEVDALDPFQQTVYLEGNRGKPMDLEVVTDSVETKSRKLSAAYSLESADDLNALDGLDIESELSQSLGDEILRELDRELLSELHGVAGTSVPFDFANVDGRYAGEKLASMMIAFDQLNDEIAIKTKKNGATWMVVSPKVFTGMKNASNSSFVPANGGQLQPSTSLYVGTFGAGIAVYVDPYAETDTILMGYKGSELDTGFVYCPYIPLSSSGVVVNPETGDHRVMLRTRYGLHKFTDTDKSLGDSPDYYARGTIANIQLGFTN